MKTDPLQLDSATATAARSHLTTRVTPARCCLHKKDRSRALPLLLGEGELAFEWMKHGLEADLTHAWFNLSHLVSRRRVA